MARETTTPSTSTLAIVVATYGRADVTERFLRSVLAWVPADVEVVLVDDGSRDGTPALLRDFEARRRDARAVLLPANGGYSRANNIGARAATRPHLVFLNNDMELRAGWFEPYLRAFADQRVGAAGIRLVFEDGRIQHAGLELRYFGLPASRHYGVPRESVTEREPVDVAGITGACLGIGRSLFLSLGGFSERFELLYQDVDLCLRVLKKGLAVRYDPSSTIVHLESVTARPAKTPQLVAGDWQRLVGAWPALFHALEERYCRELDELGRPIVIHGIGRFGQLLAESLGRRGLDVAAFSDSNPATWGRPCCGKPVVPPEELPSLDDPVVLVATMWDHDARARLRAAGLRPGPSYAAPASLVAALVADSAERSLDG